MNINLTMPHLSLSFVLAPSLHCRLDSSTLFSLHPENKREKEREREKQIKKTRRNMYLIHPHNLAVFKNDHT